MPEMCTMFVCESGGNWVGLLRRQLVDGHVIVSKVEQNDELEEELTRDAAACMAIQADALHPEDTLAWLVRIKRRYPRAFILVVASPVIPKWPFFEAGASFVVSHALQVSDAGRVIRRFFRSRLPREKTSDSIRPSLPWS